jgi:uncharacterized membrane protein
MIITLDTFLLALRSSQGLRRYALGLMIAASSLALSFALAIITFKDSANRSTLWLQVALGIFLAFACCSLQRRPDVYYKGSVVDGQFTVSAISRWVIGFDVN